MHNTNSGVFGKNSLQYGILKDTDIHHQENEKFIDITLYFEVENIPY